MMLLGLAALAAASLGIAALRLPGFALLATGGAIAAVTRWAKELHDLDREAVAELATARERLAEENYAGAISMASRAASHARTSRTRNGALTTLAWAAVGQGYPERAKAALDKVLPTYAIDVYCLAVVESLRGKTELAIDALELERTSGTLTQDGAKLLVDCYVRQAGVERAVAAALTMRDLLGAENCKTVVKAANDSGAHAAAARLASALRSDVLALRAIQDVHAS
jgi:hypothetical protein